MPHWRHEPGAGNIPLPLSAPGLAATATYAFILGWNEYVSARTFINSEQRMTMPVGLERHFVRALTEGAVKH